MKVTLHFKKLLKIQIRNFNLARLFEKSYLKKILII